MKDAHGQEKEIVVDTDEGVREGTDLKALAKLPPAFTKDGTTTAGNCALNSLLAFWRSDVR